MIHVNQVLSLEQSRWWWVKLCTHLRSTGSGTFCRPSNECCHRHRAPLITNLSPAKVYGLALLQASPGRGSLSLISVSVVLEMPKAAHRQQRSPNLPPSLPRVRFPPRQHRLFQPRWLKLLGTGWVTDILVQSLGLELQQLGDLEGESLTVKLIYG